MFNVIRIAILIACAYAGFAVGGIQSGAATPDSASTSQP
jgi:hypothetical protein